MRPASPWPRGGKGRRKNAKGRASCALTGALDGEWQRAGRARACGVCAPAVGVGVGSRVVELSLGLLGQPTRDGRGWVQPLPRHSRRRPQKVHTPIDATRGKGWRRGRESTGAGAAAAGTGTQKRGSRPLGCCAPAVGRSRRRASRSSLVVSAAASSRLPGLRSVDRMESIDRSIDRVDANAKHQTQRVHVHVVSIDSHFHQQGTGSNAKQPTSNERRRKSEGYC